jgi:NAD(P)-dependent dehydrogenase (short-subunit alcohol dehydrogenase family)
MSATSNTEAEQQIIYNIKKLQRLKKRRKTMSKVWIITGAGRGMGRDIAKAGLAASHKVVATGRNTEKVAQSIGEHENLLVTKLDVTKPTDAESAVKATVERFGTIDVLVNNAASCFIGFFEEVSPAQMEQQLATNLIGPMNVTRAVLPVMRKQRSGHIISISSTAGFVGYEYCSAYATSKFGLEGWMESLALDIAPFGIKTTIVEPGFFRTSLLEPTSTVWPEVTIDDYAERNEGLSAWWKEQNGKQAGDPAKLAKALISIADQNEPPLRWLAGADAVSEGERKMGDFKAQIEAYRELSSSLAHEES